MPGVMSFVHVARWYSIPPLYATYSKLTPWFAKKAYLDPKALYMALTKIKFNVPKKTKRTIIIQTSNNEITLAKDTIRFTIEEEEINGSTVGQRPEERIGKRYRRS